MGAQLLWHGHANFQIQSKDCNLIVDPFFTHNPKATVSWEEIAAPDLVLVTHLHGDHEGDAVALCKKHGSTLGIAVNAADAMTAKGVPQEQVVLGIGFNIGGTIMHKGVAVTMTEAFHSADVGRPTGFIIRLQDGFTIYHAGDTGIFSSMELWGQLYPIDLALLPIGGTFTMDGRAAALAAKLLGAKAVLPMHWGTFPALVQDTSEFEAHLSLCAPKCRMVRMEPGQTLDLPALSVH